MLVRELSSPLPLFLLFCFAVVGQSSFMRRFVMHCVVREVNSSAFRFCVSGLCTQNDKNGILEDNILHRIFYFPHSPADKARRGGEGR